MIAHETRKKLQDIIRGALLQGQRDHCTTIRNLLIESFGTSSTVKSEFQSRAILKEKQAQFLRSYAEKNALWLPSLPEGSQYLTRGGEAQIYLASDAFNSVTIHNLLFPNTAYSVMGFTEISNGLHIVVQQPFVEGKQAELEHIEEFLTFNGFANIKRQDYYNKEFGLLLEDMHDENVIAKGDLLFFIDTVFYVMMQ